MENLKNHLESINFSYQLSEVQDLLSGAKATTTFWGNRVVTVEGFSGSVYLEKDLVTRVRIAAAQRCDADNLEVEERLSGIAIIKKLQQFYVDTDAMFNSPQCHWITKFLKSIWEFSLSPYTERFFLEELGVDKFLAFSRKRFLNTFGGRFEGIFQEHPDAQGSFGPPRRIIAREESIERLALLQKAAS